MVGFLAAIAAIGPIIGAILGFLGIAIKNPVIAIVGVILFLYTLGSVISLPPFIWVALVLAVIFTLIRK